MGNTVAQGLKSVLVGSYPDLLNKPDVLRLRILQRREELLRLLLSGHRVKECAVLLRTSPWTLRRDIRNEYFEERLQQLSGEVFQSVDKEILEMKLDPVTRLSELADTALDNLSDLLGSSDESIKLRATQDALDRHTPTSKIKQVHVDKRVVTLDLSKIQQAEETGKEVDAFHRTRDITAKLVNPSP
ncbi:MAG: hypothetical protein V3S69_02020 [Dehalococcoidales bacterium]